ncbi:MAG: cyclodeaminase/cyclohydrolase family protein, partial [Bacteroidales bacterium]|nr:cyclodeaminase/cyclohydrolase family protein [Bacteroidales bacterium]
MNELLSLVDEDTAAFNKIMDVFAMPKGTEEEKAARAQAMEDATLYATQVPLRTLKTAAKVFEVAEQMASKGNPNSVSDAGVAAIAARGAVMGARLNVHINAEGLKDRMKAEELMNEADRIMAQAVADEKRILEIVENTIKG